MSVLFPSGILPQGPPVQPGKALLLLDFQNDFISPDGKLPVKCAPDFISQLPILTNKFRAKGTIIWSRTEYTQPRRTYVPELGANGILLGQPVRTVADHAGTSASGVPNRRRSNSQQASTQNPPVHPEAFLSGPAPSGETVQPCLPGSWGSEYPIILSDAIDRSKDIEIIKSNYSAFAESPLLLTLRMRLITHIYVCGSLSNISVYASVLDAVRHGIEVTLIEDLLGYITDSCHMEAIGQMVDSMGAGGIDYSELMDDLAGLLGDVIREEDFSSRFQVSLPSAPPGPSLSQIKGQQSQSATPSDRKYRSVEEWRSKIWPDESKLTEAETENDRIPQKTKRESPSTPDESSRSHKSTKIASRHNTPDLSPSHKRSTSDLDDVEDNETPRVKSTRKDPLRPSPSHTKSAEGTRQKLRKPRVRRPRPSEESSTRPKTLTAFAATVTQSTGDLPDLARTAMATDPIVPSTHTPNAISTSPPSTPSPPQPCTSRKTKRPKSTLPLIHSPALPIGTGDSYLYQSILAPNLANTSFTALRTSIQWAKMYHRTGEVPRLVAVQGQSSPTSPNDIPIYRHPADESPELLPFDSIVLQLKEEAEKVVGHKLNHVLIQWYRNGEDSISEHADKTLDIVQGSMIVNFSLGARRTMTLRTKRVEEDVAVAGAATGDVVGDDGDKGAGLRETMRKSASRETQRIHLPHNSIFVLGPETNRYWLHAIRADKRPDVERDIEERAFGGERISLTFRHIGTFVNMLEGVIWGQGARGKSRSEAGRLLKGREAGVEGEKMIIGFGKENHQGKEWDWEETYGRGFDVVNFEMR